MQDMFICSTCGRRHHDMPNAIMCCLRETDDCLIAEIDICQPRCDHSWDGPVLEISNMSILTCSKCGVPAHDYLCS